MKARQIIVNLILVALLVALGLYCYSEGKAYDVLLSNVAATDPQGREHESMEAVQVRVLPAGKRVKLYADDSLIYEGQIVGSKIHKLEIVPLDLEDHPIKEQARVVDVRARQIPQVTKRGLSNRVIYIGLAYETGNVEIQPEE